jgi:hypothetical protein
LQINLYFFVVPTFPPNRNVNGGIPIVRMKREWVKASTILAAKLAAFVDVWIAAVGSTNRSNQALTLVGGLRVARVSVQCLLAAVLNVEIDQRIHVRDPRKVLVWRQLRVV